MNKYISILCLSMALSTTVAMGETISGFVKDKNGAPVKGALVSLVESPTVKAITNEKGLFSIDAEIGEMIEVNYADSKLIQVWAEDEMMQIVLDDRADMVVSQSFSRSALRNTSAVSTVYAEEIERNSDTSPYNTFMGLLPGLVELQGTGYDQQPTRIIRGRGNFGGNPVYVVDGVVRLVGNINPADIENVTVLKDGPALALYGTQAANGAIVITTKRGKYNSSDIDVRYTHGVDVPINVPQMADAASYAKAVNEALYYDSYTKAGGYSDDASQYSDEVIGFFQDGSNPDLYPNVDWMDAITRDVAQNNQLDIIFRGGGEKLRYYSSINYKNNFGLLNDEFTEYTGRYDGQARNYELAARMNLDIDMTKSTLVKFNMQGLLRQTSNVNDVDGIFQSAINTPAGAFPIKTQSGYWGASSLFTTNPVAEIGDKGFYRTDQRLLQADMRIIQDFSMYVKGLSFDAGVAFDNNVVYAEKGSKTYDYEINVPGADPAVNLRDDGLSISNGGYDSQYVNMLVDAAFHYNRSFGKHVLNASAIYRQETAENNGQNKSYYHQHVIGLVGYNYADKYMVDGTLNYSGTAVLPEGDQFNFYPSVGAAWVLSNEGFLKDAKALNFLKLRASAGKTSIDNIAYDLERQFFVGGGGYTVGAGNTSMGGSSVLGTMPVPDLQIESSLKYNVGIDAQLFDGLSVMADAYMDQRRNILVEGSTLVSGVVGQTISKACGGAVDSKGLELSLMWEQNFDDFNYYIGGNIDYMTSNVIENGEAFPLYPYLSGKGHPLSQAFGLVADGYFDDQAEIDAAPEHTFSEVRPGDIKYVDQNNDNKIDSNDKVAIGYSTAIPEYYYGASLGFEYKGFGVDVVFQGLANYTKFLNTAGVHRPLRNGANISEWYLNDMVRWTEDTKATANMPRLSTLDNSNNYQTSTQWMVDASYFKLRNLNVYYNLPKSVLSKLNLNKAQIFVRGNNLWSLDHIDTSNCEDLSVGYSDVMSVYAGVNINF